MLWAIIWDIIGSGYEKYNVSHEDFELFYANSRFSDDTVLTVAVADALMNNKDLVATLQEYTRNYPNRGYGTGFFERVQKGQTWPYNSFGNGSAMRVSSVGWMFNSLEDTLERAKKTAEVTHNHPDAIKGAQAIASAMFLARTGKSKEEIKRYIEDTFGYELDFDYYEFKKTYEYDASCNGTVPQAIVCFLISKDYEDAIRKAVALGGDSDTIACMAWSIAEAFYKEIPLYIIENARTYFDDKIRIVVDTFREKYVLPKLV